MSVLLILSCAVCFMGGILIGCAVAAISLIASMRWASKAKVEAAERGAAMLEQLTHKRQGPKAVM